MASPLRRHAKLWIPLAFIVVAAVAVWFVAVPAESDDDPDYLDPSLPVAERVADLLDRMTVEEKAGQMTQVAVDAVQGDAVTERAIGSLLNGGSDALHDTPKPGPR
ncbi:hypothetical protein GCM10029992_34450 [Glycomyces albus]